MAHTNVELEIAKCFESPTNPRGTVFDKTAQAELTASISEKGVLMPVLARPSKGGKYEIIAGNRRLRAAKDAGLAWIPARVVDMTDLEAREAQIVENLQRADINPIDEATAYDALINASKLDVEGVAAKVGKSVSYIRGRLALLNLDKPYVEKVRTGFLPVGHAQLIARLDKEDQEAAYRVAVYEFNGAVQPLNLLKKHVENVTFIRAMANPPWADDDAAKVEIARVTGITGTKATTLFGEKAADKIDDPAQYALALAAYIKMTIDKYKADGKKLSLVRLEYGSSDKGSRVLRRSQFTLITGKKGCPSAQDGLVVEGKSAGTIVRICRAAKCAVHNPPTNSGSSAPREETPTERKKREESEKAQAAKEKRENAAFVKAIGKVKAPLTDAQVDVLFGLVTTDHWYEAGRVGEKFGITKGDEDDSERDAVVNYFSKDKSNKLQFIFAVLIEEKWDGDKLLKKL